MKFLFSVIATGNENDDPSVMEAIDAFNLKLIDAGQRIIAVGISGPDHAITVDNRGESPEITEGPAVAQVEFQAGIWIIEAADAHEARELAIEASACCRRKIEVRPLLGQ
jgi:hypothetical protein